MPSELSVAVSFLSVVTRMRWGIKGYSGLRALGPRHTGSAVRAGAFITSVGTLVTIVFAVVDPSPDVPGWANAVSPIVLAAATLGFLRGPRRLVLTLCVLIPLAGVGLVTGLDVATRDGSAAGQAFFWLPVLYAASQLCVPGATIVTAAAVAGTGIVSLSEVPGTQGPTDFVYIGVSLILTAVLLCRAGHVQDHLHAKLLSQAAVDPLTGLVTRRVLDDATQAAITGARSLDGTALILLDLDRFKLVNDTYGHPAGDDALSHVGAVLNRMSHTSDVIARMGGDELAVLMPGCAYSQAISRAEDFVRAVRESPVQLPDGTELSITISAGVAHSPEHAYQVRDLYISADEALYVAKRAGRDRVGRLDIAPAYLR
jgi:diguanylate cyclase (GGDEF)-like protein